MKSYIQYGALVLLFAASCKKLTPESTSAEPPSRSEEGPPVSQEQPRPAAGLHAPAAGATMFTVYDAFLSPAQEPGEESEAPRAPGLKASAASTVRKERTSRGYGQVRFTRDLSRAYIDVQIEGVRAEDITMFHIHCGPPGVLGPIIVDLGAGIDLQKDLGDGTLSLEIGNDDVTFAEMMPKGLKPRLPEGCPIDKGLIGQVKTIAGVENLARKGVLYFNLHSKAHTFYGEMRGQIYAAQ